MSYRDDIVKHVNWKLERWSYGEPFVDEQTSRCRVLLLASIIHKLLTALGGRSPLANWNIADGEVALCKLWLDSPAFKAECEYVDIEPSWILKLAQGKREGFKDFS